jgi:hypothetical protein
MVKGATNVNFKSLKIIATIFIILAIMYYLVVFLSYKHHQNDYKEKRKLYENLCIYSILILSGLLFLTIFVYIQKTLKNETMPDIFLGGHGESEWYWLFWFIYLCCTIIIGVTGNYVILDYIEDENPAPTMAPTQAPTIKPTSLESFFNQPEFRNTLIIGLGIAAMLAFISFIKTAIMIGGVIIIGLFAWGKYGTDFSL